MAVIRVDAAINVPDKPEGYAEIPDAAWEQMMKNIWLRWWKFYYGQYQEEIDASLSDFTSKVFEILTKKTDAGATLDALVSGKPVPEGNDPAASQTGSGSVTS